MTATSPIRIGTRKSALAMAQAQQVIDALGITCEIIPIVSSGDKIAGPLRDHGGKSLFTKELDLALVQGEIDLAVHSMKDVETPLPEGLKIAAVPYREDPREVLIANPRVKQECFAKGATIGTASLRRAHQLKLHHPNITIVPCRGNIQTRLQKYSNGEFDGIILALAGLKRMGIFNDGNIDGIQANVQELDICKYIPAPGQGALVVVKRSDDYRFDDILKVINHPDSLREIQIERAVVDALNLTCHDAVGVYSKINGNEFFVKFILFKAQGFVEEMIQGPLENQQRLIQDFVEHVSKFRM